MDDRSKPGTSRTEPASASGSEQDGECPWCSARAAADATHCATCGAALAQRESLAGLVIPGVTAVDPALVAFDAQPLRFPDSSPSQGWPAA